MKTINNPALIVVDYQHDFASPQGDLSVKEGHIIGDSIKQLVDIFTTKGREVLFTGDLHPTHHISFASRHGVDPYTVHEGEMRWPDHCIDKTSGATLYPPLDNHAINIKKGFTQDNHSYSAFGGVTMDETQTLDQYLQSKNIDTLYVTGLATDYCVGDTALDSRNPQKVQKLYNTTLVVDAIKGVNPETTDTKVQTMKNAGIHMKTTKEILEQIK